MANMPTSLQMHNLNCFVFCIHHGDLTNLFFTFAYKLKGEKTSLLPCWKTCSDSFMLHMQSLKSWTEYVTWNQPWQWNLAWCSQHFPSILMVVRSILAFAVCVCLPLLNSDRPFGKKVMFSHFSFKNFQALNPMASTSRTEHTIV